MSIGVFSESNIQFYSWHKILPSHGGKFKSITSHSSPLWHLSEDAIQPPLYLLSYHIRSVSPNPFKIYQKMHFTLDKWDWGHLATFIFSFKLDLTIYFVRCLNRLGYQENVCSNLLDFPFYTGKFFTDHRAPSSIILD